MSAGTINGLKDLVGQKDIKELLKEQQDALLEQDALSGLKSVEEAATRITPSALAAADVVSLSEAAKGDRTNLMGGNFAGAHEQSAYIKAKVDGMQSARQMESSFNGSIISLMPEDMQAEAAKHGDRTAQQAQKTRDGITAGESAMRDIQANVSRQAEQAAAPRDENGEVIEEAVVSAPAAPAAQTAYQAAAAAAPAPVAPAPAATGGGGGESSGNARKVSVNVNV